MIERIKRDLKISVLVDQSISESWFMYIYNSNNKNKNKN